MRNKKGVHFNRILEACDLHDITNLLQFRYNWNQEIISEFYFTLFYDKKEKIFMWMTNDRRFHMTEGSISKPDISDLRSDISDPTVLTI
jgi:hypothetical protein